MPKERIYEIAKRLNVSSKELITKLTEMGVAANSHMSAIEESDVNKLADMYSKGNTSAKKETTFRNKTQEGQGHSSKPSQDNINQRNQKPFNSNNNRNNQSGNNSTPERRFDNRPNANRNQVQGQGQYQNNNNRNNTNNVNNNSNQRPFAGKPHQGGEGNRFNKNNPNRNTQNNSGNQKFIKKDHVNDNKNHNPAQASSQAQAHDRVSSDKNRDKPPVKPQANQNHNNNQPRKKHDGNFNMHNKNSKPFHNDKQAKPKLPPKPAPVKQEPEKEEIKLAIIPANITLKNFAETIGRNPSMLIKSLIKKGMMVNLNQEIDFETASKLAEEYNVLLELAEEQDIYEEFFKEEPEDEKLLSERPPVVVVMGHVDHGKTSLLDAIRQANVTNQEAGGITQHIGAYTTRINERSITFLDTPGHEAFTAMRMRGASVTDIAILVVAADDGVMPQTIEAINHAKAAGVEIIVAINKIDKPSANPDRVKQELVEYGLLAEDWGGETICVPVSAMNKTGIDTLLEMIILLADMKELKANPDKKAKGTVIEALLDKGRGPVATVLVQSGTLQIGDSIVAGTAHGKIRAMIDDKGKRVKKAGPSQPVEILGLSETPLAGDTLYATDNEKQARQLTESLVAKGRVDMTRASVQKVSLDDLFEQIQSGNIKDLNIVIKADVQGSVEAVKQSLERLSNDEVRIRTIHGGVGAITESDVMLASTSNAIIIGFNVRPDATAKAVADDQKVDIRLYRVIYNAIEDINAAIKGMLDPEFREKVLGHAEIRQIFKASGIGTIGGSYITDGKFQRNAKVRIIRDGIVIYEGELDSLKRFKDDVKEVNSGYECGLLFNKFNDIKEGDMVEAFVMEEIPR